MAVWRKGKAELIPRHPGSISESVAVKERYLWPWVSLGRQRGLDDRSQKATSSNIVDFRRNQHALLQGPA